jgi:hypothetical protein
MIDVDYYVDMPRHLSRNFRPLVLYTFQPSRAGKADGEYSYVFGKDGKVKYNVAGGGDYNHHVWNWKGDSVGATRTILGCIPITYSVFSVERKYVDEDHQLILLAPLSKFTGVHAWIGLCRARTAHLERFNPVDGDFVRVQVKGTDGVTVSTARVGGHLAANVPVQVDEAIASTARMTNKITHATVKSKMAANVSEADQSCVDFTGSEVLLEYHLRGVPRAAHIDLVDGVRGYQWLKTYQDYEPEKPAMVAFMRPLYDGAFVPDRCRNNDERMVTKRVKELRHTARTITPLLDTVMKEFVELFVSHTGMLHPVEVEEVYARQSRPSQRRILDEAQHGSATNKAQVMQKNEAYPKVNDPRAITMINGVDKMAYSQFIYAVADELKQMKWYAFGKTPKQVAAEVAIICGRAKSHADNTDFSRQDGRVDALARTLERRLMVALFGPRYVLALLKLMKSQTGLRCKTRHGVNYNSRDARASGSAETSAFNTILNAFIAFLGFRMTREGSSFLDARESWGRLGLYGGDDGITADQCKQSAERAASMMGQVLTCERTKRGLVGVSFLSRYYGPDVWFGSEGSDNSCCDIRRQLSKFHVTVALSSRVKDTDKLREKAFAFYLTDKHTPVIGDFVRKVLEYYPLSKDKYANILNIWNSDIDQENQYPNTYEGWMNDLLFQQIPDFDGEGFVDWIANVPKEGLLSPPRFAPSPEPVVDNGLAVVGGDVHGKVGNPPKNGRSVSNSSISDGSSSKRKYRVRKNNAYRGAHPEKTGNVNRPASRTIKSHSSRRKTGNN